jgi:lambda repressor-like predicted transcriptional regulator
MHPEDIKAQLRKKFGSVFAFEDKHRLPRKSVSDFLRGRSNKNVSDVIRQVLDGATMADKSDGSAAEADSHRLNSPVA